MTQAVSTPKGFRFGAAKAGIKPHRRDVALIVSDAPCSAAGVFTINALAAAPVRHAAASLPSSGIRAIVANSGNANAFTGPSGADDERAVAEAVGRALGAAPAEILTASTGVLGMRLPVDLVRGAISDLVASLGDDPGPAAEAIRTTDLRTKTASRTAVIAGQSVTLSAIAKGSGMIHPQMATTLCFVTTDAAIAPDVLQTAVAAAVEDSFNTITIDGDMSTNDCVIVLANGRAGAPIIDGPGEALDQLQAALSDLCGELARAVVLDGEGATKLLVVDVAGVADRRAGRDIARAVAGSSLVKAGVFGGDPAWGRILAAVGSRVGARRWPVDLSRLTLEIQGQRVYDASGPAVHDKGALAARMREPEIHIRLDIGAGTGSARALGCDLSYDYVKINADYAATIQGAPSGGVARDDRLTHYSPSFKRSLVVEALGYIRKFAGKRTVIKYGGAAMIDPPLKRSFAQDVVLLQSAGLKPIVVHGGGPEITKTLERFGQKSVFADGQRITGADDVRVVEMVLTGNVNTEIVGLLNTQGGNAIGLSGKDARLLRARKLATRPGGTDLGFVGEIEAVNRDVLEMFLERGYTPVVSPVGLGDDGASYNINADVAAAEIAVAAGASKLIFLTDVPGILDEHGQLITEIKAAELEARLGRAIKGGMHVKAQAVLRALHGGVEAVHIVDGRTPHSVVAELFTDKGVGTLVTV